MLTADDDRVPIRIEYPFWFPYQTVWQFYRKHVLFVIAYSKMLSKGNYPPEHRETGYTDNGLSTRNQQCPYLQAIELVAEVSRRVNMCGVREGSPGDLLWHAVIEQFEDPKLSVEPSPGGVGYFMFRPSALAALDYCCGRDAKCTPLVQLNAVRNYRGSVRKNITENKNKLLYVVK